VLRLPYLDVSVRGKVRSVVRMGRNLGYPIVPKQVRATAIAVQPYRRSALSAAVLTGAVGRVGTGPTRNSAEGIEYAVAYPTGLRPSQQGVELGEVERRLSRVGLAGRS